MSDEARDLLVYGVAAAQANSADEARNYLEWVLRTDADPDQQAEAWYWLSYIATSPAEKRDCLENVLALSPRYPEALRDMALLDGRLKQADMHDARFPVAPVVPSASPTVAESQPYKCPRCGARMTSQGPLGALVCGFCGYKADVDSPSDRPIGVDEQDWVAAIYAVQGHRWELPTERSFKCASCGASVLLPPSQISAECPFCGVPYVTHAVEEQELIEPNGLAPFAFSSQEAYACVARWLQENKLESDSMSTTTQVPPRPIFIPFWTYDIDGDVTWRGWQISTQNRKFVRVPATGTVPLYYDDVLVPATYSIPTELLSRLQYDMQAMAPYSPDSLASWPAEIYSVSVADGSVLALERAYKSPQTQALISTAVSTAGEIEDLQVESPRLSITSYKLLMLPVWVGAYTYEEESYNVVVNGQSGVVEGAEPHRPLKRFLNVLLG
jgi:DNA-directed RNA polymerase subunit RPC12/RpoP